MAKYKLVDIEKLLDLVNEMKEYYNSDNSLTYIIEDIEDLIKENIKGGY